MKIACIGSRDISLEKSTELEKLGEAIASNGWIIASGNALGADAAYARGANKVNPALVHLYLPWRSYNKELIHPDNELVLECRSGWKDIARRHHPLYEKLSQGVKKMMDRNAGIVIGSSLVLAVLNHKATGFGGTGHGWRVATELKIPRVDLSHDFDIDEIIAYIKVQR